MKTWIFQGNPKEFNIDEYLTKKKISWGVRQEHYLDKIVEGDIVYIWRSDGVRKGSGGIIAKCKVTGSTYLVDKSKDFKEEWYVPLEVEELRTKCGF